MSYLLVRDGRVASGDDTDSGTLPSVTELADQVLFSPFNSRRRPSHCVPLYWYYPPPTSARATITLGVTMTARTDDYDAIVRVMRLYIDGFNDNDVSKFKEAFDDDAWIFYIDAAGALHKHRIAEDFERWAAPP